MSVTQEALMDIVNEMELPIETQSAYHKISVGNRAVYVAKTKRVSRVDLSGFDIKHPAVKRISENEAKELKLGKVRAQLDFSKPDDRVLEAFRSALEMMVHLAEVPETTEETPTVAKRGNKAKRRGAIKRKTETRKAAKGAQKETEQEGAHA